jgi:catechol 1,2-dioxygenase
MEDVAKLIIGAWRLVHFVRIKADGAREYPFGEDAIGYIYYSEAGVMAVQISRKSRDEVKDLARLKQGYLAYFGRYEIDPEKQVVRHFVEGEIFPGGHPAVLERNYRFEGDFMTLRPVDETRRELLWQRV